MLRSVKTLERYAVGATDGDIGHVVDFLLDDQHWTVRYLVVETGGFFSGREVLVSPISFRETDWATRRFHVALTMDKVKRSPSIDTHLPVSRQLERDYYRYYNYPYYWESTGIWGAGAYPNALAVGGWSDRPEPTEPPQDAHLRSAREVTGYAVHGSDGVVGQVADFLVDDETWEVRYLVLNTSSWWAGGEKALLSPRWATSVSWATREVRVDLSRRAVKSSPVWNTEAGLDRESEQRLHRHHGFPAYWDEGAAPAQARPLSMVDSHHSA
jgi:sporulation protein YlmC with PRC-barrel domain